MQKIISIIGSLAVGLLMAAAGLYFDVRTLTIAGIVLFGFAAVLWIYEWGQTRNAAPQQVDASDRDRKRILITRARRLAIIYTRGQSGDHTFRQYLEGTGAYAELRGFLSPEFLGKLNAPRTLYAQQDGARYEALVQWYLDDLDRLEREWHLA